MSEGRCSTTEAVKSLMPAFAPTAATDELTRAIAAADELTQAIHGGRCHPYCRGVAARPDLIPHLMVVVRSENDGGWRARIENTFYSSDQPVDMWTFAIDKVMELRQRAETARLRANERSNKPPPRREKRRRVLPMYAKIKQKAGELHPEGYDDIPTNVLINEVYRALGKDAPKHRYKGERALGRREPKR